MIEKACISAMQNSMEPHISIERSAFAGHILATQDDLESRASLERLDLGSGTFATQDGLKSRASLERLDLGSRILATQDGIESRMSLEQRNCRERILSEDYGELLIDFRVSEPDPSYCFFALDERFGIVYPSLREIETITGSLYAYQYFPKLFGLMQGEFDPVSLISSGILQTQRPPLSLTGSGVVIAFIDTGIRFAQRAFRTDSGNSRILAIWDQNIQSGNPPDGFEYGTLFTRENINEALSFERPYEVLPSYDENGHGTAIASVAAGSIVSEVNTPTVPSAPIAPSTPIAPSAPIAPSTPIAPFAPIVSSLQDGVVPFRGAAPEADIVVVKLRESKQYIRDYYLLPENAVAYTETDIMQGIKFAESFAVTFRRPVVICIGLGSNAGNHALGTKLSQYLNAVADKRSRGVVICGGNEGNAAHHFSAMLSSGDVDSYTDVEIRVGEGERGFIMEMWGNAPDVLYASIRTPGGETVSKFRLGQGQTLNYSFIYEETKLTIDSILVEPDTGDELIVFRFDAPTPGVWTIRIYASDEIVNGRFHMWLPITQFLSSDTYFLKPDPYVTLTDPGVAVRPITVSAYNDENNSFYVDSGRGFLKNGLIKPDLSAPGVSVSTSLGDRNGTSMSAALTAGGVAQYLEWAVVRQNNLTAESQEMKSYFIRGATRSPNLEYPNREWGYGRLDVAGTFEALSRV